MKYWLRALAGAALLLCFSSGVWAQEYPAPQGYVSDFAGLLAPATKSALEERLSAVQRDTGAEIAVVTVENLGNTTIEDYAVRLFEAWGIGQENADNGILFITAVAEKKVRIEVGYGLEGIINDARAGRILDDEVLPAYRNGDWAGGITGGVTALENYIRSGAPAPSPQDNAALEWISENLPLLVTLGFISMYVLGFMARSKSIWLGGIWGLVAGVILGLAIGGVARWLTPLVSGVLGTGLDFILSRNYKARSGRGLPTGWGSSGGGFRGGGGGGSFGGFSGGHSGGGGASRGW